MAVWLPGDTDFATAWREPNLLSPGRKPVGRAQIDRNHPLAKGLKKYVLFSKAHGFIDLVENDVPQYKGGAPLQNKNNYTFNGATDYVAFEKSGFEGAAEASSVVGFFPNTFDDSTDESLVRALNATIKGWYFTKVNANSVLISLYGVDANITNQPIFGITNQEPHIIGFSYKDSDLKGYLDGAQSVSRTGTSIGLIADVTEPMTVGARYNQGSEDNFFDGDIHFVAIWDRWLSADEHSSLNRDPYQFLKPANDAPYLVSVPSGGAPGYAESYAVTAAAEIALSDTWALDYPEAYAATAAAELALSDAWSLDYPEAYAATASAELALVESYAVGNHYTESYSVSALAALGLVEAWAVDYTEAHAVSATADLALTDAWSLDYPEAYAVAASAELALAHGYSTPAPGVFDEVYQVSALAELALTHTFTTPNALPAGLESIEAICLGGFGAFKH